LLGMKLDLNGCNAMQVDSRRWMAEWFLRRMSTQEFCTVKNAITSLPLITQLAVSGVSFTPGKKAVFVNQVHLRVAMVACVIMSFT